MESLERLWKSEEVTKDSWRILTLQDFVHHQRAQCHVSALWDLPWFFISFWTPKVCLRDWGRISLRMKSEGFHVIYWAVGISVSFVGVLWNSRRTDLEPGKETKEACGVSTSQGLCRTPWQWQLTEVANIEENHNVLCLYCSSALKDSERLGHA